MNDFDSFLAKVLAPIRDEPQTQRTPAQSSLTVERQAHPEAVPAGELERRYMEVMNALLTDAHERRAIEVFTDVVAWKLAMVAYHFGPAATGDIVGKLGAHIVKIAEAEDAQREAKQAAKEGRLPS